MTSPNAFAVVVPSLPGYPYTECFREAAETVFYGLKALGLDVVMDTTCPEGRLSILFGSNVLLELGHPIHPSAILYNLEQCGSPVAAKMLPLFAKHDVWDYSARNVAFWKEHGIHSKLVPIGYVPEMTRIIHRPKDIDVLFYGSLNDRRGRVLQQLRDQGLHVEHIFGVYGADRDAAIARSKIVLNMHYYEPGIFEIARVSYLLANEVCVVSESGIDGEAFREAVYSVKYDELVGGCVMCIRDEHFRKQQAQRGFEIFSQIDEQSILREALDDKNDGEQGMNTIALYLDLLKRCLTRSAFETLTPEALAGRRVGLDWPADAETMIGHERLDNVQACIEAVCRDSIPGDLCEAGVWRGGTVIFMRGVLKALEDASRTVWVADSFEGLPRPEDAYPLDKGDPHHGYSALAVSLDEVRANFSRYGLLDDRVRFLKGWFKDTLPGPIEQLALLRLDGDMYGSTIQTLDALYDKVSPGGFIIVDDYALPGCRAAVDDFRLRRGIDQQIHKIDWTGVYWRKSHIIDEPNQPTTSGTSGTSATSAATYPELKVNIGSGGRPMAGYLNTDVTPHPGVDRVCFAWDLGLPNESVSEIQCHHVIEHFFPKDWPPALTEFWRVLKPGGRIHLSCPDFGDMAKGYAEGRYSIDDARQVVMATVPPFNSCDYNDPASYHRTVHSEESLCADLKNIGFESITPSHQTYGWNLFVEAVKPAVKP